ncbi:MAG: inositol monophosphatase family protein [Candidatus Omnitrophota bacterium]|jgi:myo-inositol-1(or 4)-monophosphatase
MKPSESALKTTLFKALRAAGKLIGRASAGQRRVIHKKAALSLVTAIDRAAEKKILAVIRSRFPDHAFLTEESPPSGRSPYRWIIDPLDGTTNFAHGYPVSCVSIGLEAFGKLIMGGVYDPHRDELFFAALGRGAFLNGKKIRVSKTKKLSDALLATGFPYDQYERLGLYLRLFKPFVLATQGLRRAGAAAIDLCYVACGRFDGYWEYKLNAWDKAAGILIVEEAGGRASNFRGQPLSLESTQNVFSNGLLHAQMLKILRPFKNIP